MDKQTLYLILQNRWGNEDIHTYCTGASFDIRIANIMGTWFASSRGGSYDHRLVVFEVEKSDKYYQLALYNNDRENFVSYICTSTKQAVCELSELFLEEQFKREFFELDELNIWTLESITDDLVDECLQWPNRFNEEELQILKDAYEKRVRNG